MANKNTAYNFGEKTKEYNAKAGKEVDVWQSPKYKEARQKAIDAIESDRFKGVLFLDLNELYEKRQDRIYWLNYLA